MIKCFFSGVEGVQVRQSLLKVHRSESVSSRKTPYNNKSQCPLHGRLQKPRDVSQIMALAHQMYPQRTKDFLEAYTAATAQRQSLLKVHSIFSSV
jgi:hypothetical protein